MGDPVWLHTIDGSRRHIAAGNASRNGWADALCGLRAQTDESREHHERTFYPQPVADRRLARIRAYPVCKPCLARQEDPGA